MASINTLSRSPRRSSIEIHIIHSICFVCNLLQVFILMQLLQAYIGQNEDNECGVVADFQFPDSLTCFHTHNLNHGRHFFQFREDMHGCPTCTTLHIF